jgi:hypothetical protein
LLPNDLVVEVRGASFGCSPLERFTNLIHPSLSCQPLFEKKF